MYTHTAATKPAMAASAAPRASQSRQKGGCGVLMFSCPTAPAIRPYDRPYSRVCQYVDGDVIGSAYAFQQHFSAGEPRGWMLLQRSTENPA
jgi:hypothetical protein